MNLKGKGSQAKNRYNRELESYKWFVVDLKENKAVTGNEFKSDALDVLSDYDDKSRYKVVSEISLKKLGIENPKEIWKYKMADGGGIGFRNIDKIKSHIGESVFNHINSLNKKELEKQLSELRNELKITDKESSRYFKLKDEEWFILYRLERSSEYEFADGGGIDLFEDYYNIPANVQKVLDKYEDAFMDGDYEGLREAKKEVNKIGYTFNFDMDGTAYGLKPLKKMAKGGGVELDAKKIGVAKRLKIKNWYIKNYPTDDLGKEIDDNLSFWSLYTLMSQRYNVYSVLEVSDSIVRERVFEKLSEILGVEYDYIYKIWLRSSDQYAKGGGIENENAYMVANNNKQIFHHTKEMAEALKGAKNVPAWVVAKVNRSASDLSDATHYLEGAEGMYAEGGVVSYDIVWKDKDGDEYSESFDTIEEVNDLIKNIKKNGGRIIEKLKYIDNDFKGYFADGGGVEDLTPVELYFKNLDYSKLPESFSNFIKTEILTDPELKYLSEREPIFIEIKEKVEKYENQNAGKVEEAEEESIGDLIAGLEVLVPISTKKEKKELLDLIEGLKLLL